MSLTFRGSGVRSWPSSGPCRRPSSSDSDCKAAHEIVSARFCSCILGADILPAQQLAGGRRVAAALRPPTCSGVTTIWSSWPTTRWRAAHPAPAAGSSRAKYIAAQFERLGLEPAGDSGTYFQRVPIIALTPSPTLAVAGAGTARRSTWKDDYVLWSMRNDSQRERRAATRCSWATGSWRPEVGWNDYAGLDVKGKIVVALVNDPGLQDSTHLPREDPDLLRPLDLQDRGGTPAGRGRSSDGPHDRERDLSLDHRALGLDRASGSAGEAARARWSWPGWLHQEQPRHDSSSRAARIWPP